ncbi:MAG: hypothetical protein ACU836_07700 [Gammaproteobacteria bacterium]
MTEIDRIDLLEQWVIHLVSEEAESRIIRESVVLKPLRDYGFQELQVKLRQEINALVTAVNLVND